MEFSGLVLCCLSLELEKLSFFKSKKKKREKEISVKEERKDALFS